MASIVLSGDTSGSITVSAPAVAGSNTQTLVAATGTLAPLISGTAVTASGTSVDFTGIPSWVKRITVMFSALSTNGTSIPQIQIGDAGGIENTGYAGSATSIGSTPASSALSSGFLIGSGWVATSVAHGCYILNYMGGNLWALSGYSGRSDSPFVGMGVGGSKTLSDTLTQIRITTVNGTDTFDAGTINILYE